MRKRTAKVKPEKLNHGEEDEEEEDKSKEGKGFYACYLLTSLCPRFKGHTYIGFTVNPRRRIKQHNGEIKCGAFRTKKRRPWEMVFCIYGFPTNVSALQFEWAWQHPTESLAVRQAAATFKSFSGVANKIKLAYTMLNLPSWQRLNITVNYFSTKYASHSAACPSLPEHMMIQVRPIDELPCYSRIGESSFEGGDAEDEFHDKLEYEQTTNISGTMKVNTELLMDKFACYSVEKGILFEGEGSKDSKNQEEYHSEVSSTSGTVKETDAGIIVHISSHNAHYVDGKSYEEIGCLEEYGKTEHNLKDIYIYYPPTPEVDQATQFGFTDSLVRTESSLYPDSSMEETSNGDALTLMKRSFSELHWPNGKKFTGKANKDLQPIHDYNVTREIEVIDLLSPSPECRIMSRRKKRRVSTVCPEIIDLT